MINTVTNNNRVAIFVGTLTLVLVMTFLLASRHLRWRGLIPLLCILFLLMTLICALSIQRQARPIAIGITLAGKTVNGGTGLAQDPITCLLWAILRIDGQFARELVTINPTTGVATSIGNTGDRFAGITFIADGTLYGVTGDGAAVPETLYRLNKTNAVPNFVRSLGNGNDGETIGFNPEDGQIYHASGIGTPNVSEIFEYVFPTLAITNVPLSRVDYQEALALVDNGAAFLLADGPPLLISGIRNLHSVTDAGVVSLIGPMDHPAKGLAFFRHHDCVVPVGGITSFVAGEPGSSSGSIALLAGGVAAVLAITLGGWYTRRRWLRGRS